MDRNNIPHVKFSTIHLSGPIKYTNEHNHSIPWHLPVVYLPHRLLPGIGGFDVEAALISIFPEGYSQGKKSYHTNLPYLWCLDNQWELIIKDMSAMFIALTLLAEEQTRSSSNIHDVCNVYFPGWNHSDFVYILYIFYIGRYRVSVYLFSIQISEFVPNRFGNLLIPKTAENQTRQESNFDQTHTHNPKEHQTIGLFLPPAIKQAVPLHALVDPNVSGNYIFIKRSTIPYKKAVGGMSRKTQNEQVSRTLA